MSRQLVGWLVLAGTLLGAQAAEPVPENPFILAGKAAQPSLDAPFNYVLPQLALRRLRATYRRSALASAYWQATATFASLADETDSVAYYWGRAEGLPEVPTLSLEPAPSSFLPAAGPAILAHTRHQQLVLFNEEHTQPRGRWLVGRLLPALYQQGFRYLAIEALNPADSAGLRQRGYPLTTSGYYTNEPHFGNLLRQARHLGFRLVAYESEAADREQGQARNLLAATLARQPTARVVVLAGHGHINEAGISSSPSMAQWLRKLSGLNPLTIDQTQAATGGPPAWQRLPAGAYLVSPQYLTTRSLTSDLYVFNHLSLTEVGNGFGQSTARAVTLRLPADSLRSGPAWQLLVYQQAEWPRYRTAEPVVVRCLWSRPRQCRLVLLPGRYIVVVRDAFGRRQWQHTLHLSAGQKVSPSLIESN